MMSLEKKAGTVDVLSRLCSVYLSYSQRVLPPEDLSEPPPRPELSDDRLLEEDAPCWVDLSTDGAEDLLLVFS